MAIDYAWFEYVPFDFEEREPFGTVKGFDVREFVFERALTNTEQTAVNDAIGDLDVIDWRDDQTLWLWSSKEELDRWLKHIGDVTHG